MRQLISAGRYWQQLIGPQLLLHSLDQLERRVLGCSTVWSPYMASSTPRIITARLITDDAPLLRAGHFMCVHSSGNCNSCVHILSQDNRNRGGSHDIHSKCWARLCRRLYRAHSLADTLTCHWCPERAVTRKIISVVSTQSLSNMHNLCILTARLWSRLSASPLPV